MESLLKATLTSLIVSEVKWFVKELLVGFNPCLPFLGWQTERKKLVEFLEKEVACGDVELRTTRDYGRIDQTTVMQQVAKEHVVQQPQSQVQHEQLAQVSQVQPNGGQPQYPISPGFAQASPTTAGVSRPTSPPRATEQQPHATSTEALSAPLGLSATLASARLAKYDDALRVFGCETVQDVANVDDQDLLELGLKKIEVNRLRRLQNNAT